MEFKGGLGGSNSGGGGGSGAPVGFSLFSTVNQSIVLWFGPMIRCNGFGEHFEKSSPPQVCSALFQGINHILSGSAFPSKRPIKALLITEPSASVKPLKVIKSPSFSFIFGFCSAPFLSTVTPYLWSSFNHTTRVALAAFVASAAALASAAFLASLAAWASAAALDCAVASASLAALASAAALASCSFAAILAAAASRFSFFFPSTKPTNFLAVSSTP